MFADSFEIVLVETPVLPRFRLLELVKLVANKLHLLKLFDMPNFFDSVSEHQNIQDGTPCEETACVAVLSALPNALSIHFIQNFKAIWRDWKDYQLHAGGTECCGYLHIYNGSILQSSFILVVAEIYHACES